MDLSVLAKRIGACLILSSGSETADVKAIHAADTMSSLIANASPDTLLVTSLNNSQLVRVVELMDAPGLCLVGGAQPSAELMDRAREAGASIVVSPRGLEETRHLLETCLA
jgi:hypothetical protein